MKPEALTAEELAWLEADEALWRRAHAIVERHPALDLTDVYHTLKNFQRTPAQRLQRGLLSKRAANRPKDLAALPALETALAVRRELELNGET